ncbi:MAG: hypothetical protein J5760_05580 [Clostridia bacterium]|nr:hypothetical protein [Clostridia bacterium]
MKRRVFAVILALAMLFPAFAVAPDAAEAGAIIIEWNEPAIPADEGEVIDLSAYKVRFAENEESAEAEWEYNGKAVTSFTPETAGVYTLTAKSGGKEKNVYVVAKKAADKEYVLYYNGFDSADALDGFTKTPGMESRYKVENSNLIIDGTGQDMVRITLPEWLGEFGNYAITASVTSTDEKDTARWNSICYRAKGHSYPFYHMCVRKNCGTGSGVEFALRTPSNGWDVKDSGTHTSNQVTGTYYIYNVRVKGDVIMQSIGTNHIIYNDAKKEYKIGCIGLIANFSVMHVDYIKVTLQLTKPEVEVEETFIRTSAAVENITNVLANVAELKNADGLAELGAAHCVIIGTDGTDIFGTDGEKICALKDFTSVFGNEIIPVFRCTTKEAVDGALAFAKTLPKVDAAILSADTDILAYARKKHGLLRGIIDLRGKYDHTLTREDVVEARALINGNNVKTGLFDAACLSCEAAEELRSMLLTVWAYTPAEDDVQTLHALLTGAHGVVTPSPEKVKAAYSLFAEDALTRTPVIIGHRGNPTNAPENSLSSYRMGYLNGADVVETDVYLSKDGEIVVMHDNDIERTTTGSGYIENMTLEQIKQYNLWADNASFEKQYPDEKIPTLREIFELMQECEGLKLFIEIKTGKPEVCEKIVALAKEYDMMSRISIISFSLEQCAKMHSVAPELSCGYLMSAPKSSSTDGLAAKALYDISSTTIGKNNTCNPAYNSLTYKFLNAANARGVTVWPWTYTASGGEKFAYAFKAGAGGITTNDAQYTKGNVKYVYAAESAKIIKGETGALEITAMTYGRKTLNVSKRVNITVISGADVVSANGAELTALKEGTAYVMCAYSTSLPVGKDKGSYTVYTDIIRVEVIPPAENGAPVFKEGSGLVCENGVITGTVPGAIVEELKAAVINSGIAVFKGDTELKSSAKLATGFVIKNAGGEIMGVIAVRGDMNGDGKCDSADAGVMADCLVEKPGTTAAMFAACDINGDGCSNVTDYILLKTALANGQN